MEQTGGTGMKKLYISADIEGTCGISAWSETIKEKPDYHAFGQRMSREVAAACEGALEAGVEMILVRDAHDSARNIDWSYLPRQAQLIRGWGEDPLSMMTGLDESYMGVVFTGYHDAAGSGENPLSHTLDTGVIWMTLNGEPLSEAVINTYTAAKFKVPLLAVTGDAGICARMQALVPGCKTVPVNRGRGGLVLSIHPEKAQQLIREAVAKACSQTNGISPLPLPEHFRLDVRYKEHAKAHKSSFYPGIQRLDSHTLRFEAEDWYEVLRMLHFCV